VTASLIASIHESKTGWFEIEKFGQARIAKVARDRGWVAERNGKVLGGVECQVSLTRTPLGSVRTDTVRSELTLSWFDYDAQGSSLGKFTPGWMHAFFNCTNGIDPRDWLVPLYSKSSWPAIKIIWRRLFHPRLDLFSFFELHELTCGFHFHAA
jgi:hypothetical protein